MKIKKKISSLFFAGAMTFATQTYASDDFFVYVSPDPIGVNAFLEMGKIGIEEQLPNIMLMFRLMKVLLLLRAVKMLKPR